MFDIHGFNPNSIKFSQNHLTFFLDLHFIFQHVKNLGRGELGNHNKSTKRKTPVGSCWIRCLEYRISVDPVIIMNPVAINEAKKVLRRELKKRINAMSDELKLKESISIVNKVKFTSAEKEEGVVFFTSLWFLLFGEIFAYFATYLHIVFFSLRIDFIRVLVSGGVF